MRFRVYNIAGTGYAPPLNSVPVEALAECSIPPRRVAQVTHCPEHPKLRGRWFSVPFGWTGGEITFRLLDGTTYCTAADGKAYFSFVERDAPPDPQTLRGET